MFSLSIKGDFGIPSSISYNSLQKFRLANNFKLTVYKTKFESMSLVTWLVVAIVIVAGLAVYVFSYGLPIGLGISRTGNLLVGVKDLAFPPAADIKGVGTVSRIDLTIKSIQVHFEGLSGNDGGMNEIEHDAEVHEANETEVNDSSDWTTIFAGTKTFNLLDYTGNFVGVLGEGTLQPGHYEQIRLFIQSASITVDGQASPLTVPSNVLKIVEEFRVDPSKTTVIVLDFDANRSVKKVNNTFILRPTIKIKETESDHTERSKVENDTGEHLEDVK